MLITREALSSTVDIAGWVRGRSEPYLALSESQ